MKAFPTLADNGHITTQDGMDLRDYFAAKAMQAYMKEKTGQVESWKGDKPIYRWQDHQIAEFAYEMADYMMIARKREPFYAD